MYCGTYVLVFQRNLTPPFSEKMSVIIILLLVFSPWASLGRTGMALVCCILGKFLGVVCHCFPPRLDFPTFASRCLHVCNDVRDPSSERWNYGQEKMSGNFAYMASLFTPLGIFYMLQIYDMGPTAFLPL
jgi:hypothetical protein